MPTWTMVHQRAEELLAELPDNSIDLILTDPPYYRVKDADWDRQWKTEVEFLAWLGTILEQYKRVLKPNGSLYVFASPQMAAEVEVLTKQFLCVVNSVTWRKTVQSSAEKYGPENFRGFVEMSERIIFAERRQCWPNTLREARERAGLSRQDVSEVVVGSRSGACWNWEAGIRFPEREHWERLRHLFAELPSFESVERPFFLTADTPYTDVWDFPNVQAYPGKHECEKPQELLQHIIKASSRPGAVVLDTFAGSGSTGQAALTLGRSFIGCDASEHWDGYAQNRLRMIEQQLAQGGPVVWPIGRSVKFKPLKLAAGAEQTRLF